MGLKYLINKQFSLAIEFEIKKTFYDEIDYLKNELAFLKLKINEIETRLGKYEAKNSFKLSKSSNSKLLIPLVIK